jgi:anti-anti-sigma factor
MLNMEGSALFLRAEGELTIYQVEEINKQLCTLFGNAETVIVDMSKVDKIDTAGFQLLVSLKQSCENSQKNFEINGTGESVRNFFTLFGLVLEDNEDYFGLKAPQ